MGERYEEVKCPACGKLLYRRRYGGEQEIVCRCKRLLRVLITGQIQVVRDTAARER